MKEYREMQDERKYTEARLSELLEKTLRWEEQIMRLEKIFE